MRIMIALDGSAGAWEGLHLAETMLSGKDAHVVLVHVLPRHYVYGKMGRAPVECYDVDETRSAAQHLLDTATEELKAAGVGPEITSLIVTGDPAEQILHIANDTRAELLVIGSRGLNAAQRFLLGSVSSKVVQHAPCAVLVGHGEAAA